MFKVKRLSELNDLIGFVVLSAPDRFPQVGAYCTNQTQNLLTAFEKLNDGFYLVQRKIPDPVQLQKLRRLLQDALSAYQQADRKKGAHLLQEFQDSVFAGPDADINS